MQRMPRTHYDNLKVSREAPPEVIRAAYRALSQKYHPDLNKSTDAHRVMQILNDAWSVLGDPQKRASYDERLTEIENDLITEAVREAATPAAAPKAPPPPPPPRSSSPREPPASSQRRPEYVYTPPPEEKSKVSFGSVVSMMVFATLGLMFIFGNLPAGQSTAHSPTPAAPTSGTTAPVEVPPPGAAQAAAQVPAVAMPAPAEQSSWEKWSPSGQPWPSQAKYIPGLKIRSLGGLSTLTIDNSNGSGDVHVKLCKPVPGPCDGLRHLFLPDGNRFTMEAIHSGSYEIRYRDLSSGRMSKTPPFDLTERETDTGTEFSTVTMTLFKVQNGNMSVTPIGEDEF